MDSNNDELINVDNKTKDPSSFNKKIISENMKENPSNSFSPVEDQFVIPFGNEDQKYNEFDQSDNVDKKSQKSSVSNSSSSSSSEDSQEEKSQSISDESNEKNSNADDSIQINKNALQSSRNILQSIQANKGQTSNKEIGLDNAEDATNSQPKKKHLERRDLYNREKSKLACLIRKKYTTLMKNSIKLKGVKERYVCCSSFRKVTSKVIYQLTGTVVQSIISIFAIILYVVSTYYPDYSQVDTLEGTEKSIVMGLKWSELAIAILVNIDYVYNLVTSKQKCKYLWNFLNLLDLIIIVSVYINFVVPNVRSLAFIRVFRVIRIMRVFRFYKIIESQNKDSQEENKNEMSRRLISAILTVLAVVFLATGVVHFLNENFNEYFQLYIPSMDTITCESGSSFSKSNFDPSNEGLSISISCPQGDSMIRKRGKITFDLAFYYMVITMATVGYGDIYPNTSWMRLVVGIFVIISIITITKQTSELNDLIKLNSEYQVPYKQASGCKHCVLSGFFNKSSLIKFLNEFYHIDHKENSENTKIVIIQSDYPDKEIQSILMNPKFEENLHYLIGDIFSENTLQAAMVQSASGIFLISDQNHPEAMKNDQFLILACKAVSQYSQSPLYVQFNFSQSLLHDWADWDMACSSQQIKMSIIVKNGLISGFATMIMNLSSSSSSFYNSDIKETPWMLEYIHGASQEIYIVKIPTDYFKDKNRDFSYFSEKAYIETGSLVIGVKRKIYYQEDRAIFYFIYLLNPVHYELQPEDEIVVISADFEEAKSIFTNKIYIKQSINAFPRKNFKDQNQRKSLSMGKNPQIYQFSQPEVISLQTNQNIDNPFIGEEKEKSSRSNVSNMDLMNERANKNQGAGEIYYDPSDNFFQLFCDENKGLSSINIIEDKFENIKFKIGDTRQSVNYAEQATSQFYAQKKVVIPDIFQKRQHFKIWESNLEDFLRELKSHYLIFCKEDHLWEFMNAFDQYYSEVVFFVSDQHPSPKWDILRRYFKNLIYVECSYSDQEDLGKLNLEKAKHVFILTYEVENSNVNDSGILPLVKIIEESYPKCKYTLELSDELNVRYLNNKGVEDDNSNDESEALVKNKKNKNKKVARMPVRLWPKYAKSDIFFASSLESLAAFSYHNEGVLDVLTKILGFNNNLIRDSKIKENDQISMYRYIGTEKILYERVVKNFFSLEPPIIPIAVYRVNSDRELKNDSPFIITNPKKDLELNYYDKVICIGISKLKIFEDFDEKLETESYVESEIDEDDVKRDSAIFTKKNTNLNDDLENLDEDQLIEKLKTEIQNLRLLSKSSKKDFGTLGKFKLFDNQKSFNIIEEKNEDLEDVVKQTESDDKEKKTKSKSVQFNLQPEKKKKSKKDSSDSESKSGSEASSSSSESSSIKKKKKRSKKIINNNNYSIKINAQNQFQKNNTINIQSRVAFSGLSIAAPENFNILNK